MTPTYRAGDIFVEHGTDLFSRIVQFGQRWRFPQLESRWSHAGVIVGDDGTTVEAEANGVQQRKLTPDRNVMVIAIEPQEARDQVAKFATSRLGDKYGWATIACLVLRLLPPDRLTFGVSGSLVCSGLVAEAMFSASSWLDTRLLGDPVEDTYPAQIADWAAQHKAIARSCFG